uniref:Uncharacterized protein n=1 Tax=Oryza brachyantha TaxID=4533 RepID=J3LXY8_ORYBR
MSTATFTKQMESLKVISNIFSGYLRVTTVVRYTIVYFLNFSSYSFRPKMLSTFKI